MPRNEQVTRLWHILRTLEAPRGLTLQELADRLPPDAPRHLRTIRRDVYALEASFEPTYERDYNIFNPASRYQPDNPLNPANAYDPNSAFNPANRYDPGNPVNPANRYSPDNPFNPANRYHPDNPLNPANRHNPAVPFAPLDGGSRNRNEGK